MNRLTRTVSVLGAGAIALALTACGGSDESEYCDLIADATQNSSLPDAEPTDGAAMEEVSSTFREIAEAAPDDIRGDWNAVADSWATSDLDEEAFAEMSDSFENISRHIDEECDLELG